MAMSEQDMEEQEDAEIEAIVGDVDEEEGNGEVDQIRSSSAPVGLDDLNASSSATTTPFAAKKKREKKAKDATSLNGDAGDPAETMESSLKPKKIKKGRVSEILQDKCTGENSGEEDELEHTPIATEKKRKKARESANDDQTPNGKEKKAKKQKRVSEPAQVGSEGVGASETVPTTTPAEPMSTPVGGKEKKRKGPGWVVNTPIAQAVVQAVSAAAEAVTPSGSEKKKKRKGAVPSWVVNTPTNTKQ